MSLISRTSSTYYVASIAVLLTALSAPSFAQDRAPAAQISAAESDRIDAYLEDYYSGVVIAKTATDQLNESWSCVNIETQPALKNPRLRGIKIQTDPSPELKALLGGKVKADDTATLCPSGTIQMKLPTREQIVRTGSLDNFLSKSPDARPVAPAPTAPPSGPTPPAITSHEYAIVYNYVNALAAQATINVWQPTIGTYGDFSLTQLWVVGGTGGATQTVEAGAQVYPSFYGDYLPHFFIYFTADNYVTTGCYNLSCGAFVQTSNVLPIGGAVPSSTSGGTQYEGTIAFYRDPSTHNWILFRWDGTSYIQSGFYPVELFGSGQLTANGTLVEFGGEIYSTHTTTHTGTDMGSGQPPNAGYGYAAYQRNLKYMNLSGTVLDFPAVTYMTNPGCYDAALTTTSGWGSAFYFGGPGYSPTLCP